MKLGILSDIHEAVEMLERALARFDREGVDRVLVLGDVFETGPRMDETVALLDRAGAFGVYGNHDYGLCVEPTAYIRDRFSAPVLDYMARLRPRIEVEGSLFAHREPWLDAADLFQIWHVDEEPLTSELIARSFDAVPHRSIFVGHFHCWRAFDRSGPLPWLGDAPFVFPEDRSTLMIVHAVCEGYTATLDTATRQLNPIDLYQGEARPDRRPIPPLVPG